MRAAPLRRSQHDIFLKSVLNYLIQDTFLVIGTFFTCFLSYCGVFRTLFRAMCFSPSPIHDFSHEKSQNVRKNCNNLKICRNLTRKQQNRENFRESGFPKLRNQNGLPKTCSRSAVLLQVFLQIDRICSFSCSKKVISLQEIVQTGFSRLAAPTKNRHGNRACLKWMQQKYQISMLPVNTFSQLPVI